jgi:hypothetical protein
MPSILRKSSAFTSQRIALVSQGLSIEPTGLVTVSVTYQAAESDNDYWAGKFVLDSQPPIWPDVVTQPNLQSGSLFMGQVSTSKSNGLVEINATYFGALRSALSGKNKTTALQTQSGTVAAEINLNNYINRATFRSQIIEYKIACIGTTYTVPEPTKQSLLIAFQSITAQFISNVWFGGAAGTSTSMSYAEYLALVANRVTPAQAFLNAPAVTVLKEESSEYMTPTVTVNSTRFSLACDSIG